MRSQTNNSKSSEIVLKPSYPFDSSFLHKALDYTDTWNLHKCHHFDKLVHKRLEK